MESLNSINWSLFGALFAFACCALFRTIQLSIIRSRGAELRGLGRGRNSWRYARLIRGQAGRYLSACQTGFFISCLILGLSAGLTVRHEILPLMLTWPEPATWLVTGVMVILIGTLALFVLQFLRAVAFSMPERVLLFFAKPTVFVFRIVSPIFGLVNGIVERAVKPLGLRAPCEKEIAVPLPELSELVELSNGGSGMEEEEKEMIKSVLLIADTAVREIMTPRADIITVEVNAGLTEVAQTFRRERVSRVLVVGDTLDDVKGILHAKDLLPFIGPGNSGNFDVTKLMRPACFIPGSAKVDEILKRFQTQGIHLAVVLNEHGSVDGVITVEDLLEELVGEIFDEFDSPAEESLVRRAKNGDYIIDGGMAVEEFNERFKGGVPLGEYDTIAGYVLQSLNRIPEQGELLETGRLKLRVEEVDQNRITKLRLMRVARLRRQNHSKPEKESIPSEGESNHLKVSRESQSRLSVG